MGVLAFTIYLKGALKKTELFWFFDDSSVSGAVIKRTNFDFNILDWFFAPKDFTIISPKFKTCSQKLEATAGGCLRYCSLPEAAL
jgi:hypothetical protein